MGCLLKYFLPLICFLIYKRFQVNSFDCHTKYSNLKGVNFQGSKEEKEECQSGNSSVENVRRFYSMPGLSEPNLSSFANISKISMVKDCGESKKTSFIKSKEAAELKEKPDEEKQNLSNDSEIVNASDSSECVEFVRNEPQTRLSQNIKQLFKNVVEHQVNALTNLERFYEAQLEKLECERRRSIAQAPYDDQVKEFYEKQLNLLEERVHSSLTFISQNKCTKFESMSRASQSRLELDLKSPPSSDPINIEQQKQSISNRLSRVMIVKQTQQNSQLQNVQANNAQRTFKSRTLLGLKSNLLSKNNLLPSKSALIQNRSGEQNIFSIQNNLFFLFISWWIFLNLQYFKIAS